MQQLDKSLVCFRLTRSRVTTTGRMQLHSEIRHHKILLVEPEVDALPIYTVRRRNASLGGFRTSLDYWKQDGPGHGMYRVNTLPECPLGAGMQTCLRQLRARLQCWPPPPAAAFTCACLKRVLQASLAPGLR